MGGGSKSSSPTAVLSPDQRAFIDQFLLPLLQGDIEQGFNFQGDLVPGASDLQRQAFGDERSTFGALSQQTSGAQSTIAQLLSGQQADVAGADERLAFFQENIADPTRQQAALPGGLLDQVAARFGSRGPTGVAAAQGASALANLELDLARQAGGFAAGGFDAQTQAALQAQQLQLGAVDSSRLLGTSLAQALGFDQQQTAALGAEQRAIAGEGLQADFQQFLMNNFTVLSPVFQAALGAAPTGLTPASVYGG